MRERFVSFSLDKIEISADISAPLNQNLKVLSSFEHFSVILSLPGQFLFL